MRTRNRYFVALAACLAVAWCVQAIAADAATTPKALPAVNTSAEPYPLTTCPVTDGELGTMGDPIVKVIDGREVRFCCGGCPATFEADKAKYTKKMDNAIIALEKPKYPLKTCVVTGEKLGEKGAPVAYVHNNRLFMLSSEACKAAIDSDTAKYSAALNKAVIDQQKASYPLDTCVVSGDKLGGAMGEPVSIVASGRLVQLCCPNCIGEFNKDPSKYLAMIDKAKKGGSKAAGDETKGK